MIDSEDYKIGDKIGDTTKEWTSDDGSLEIWLTEKDRYSILDADTHISLKANIRNIDKAKNYAMLMMKNDNYIVKTTPGGRTKLINRETGVSTRPFTKNEVSFIIDKSIQAT